MTSTPVHPARRRSRLRPTPGAAVLAVVIVALLLSMIVPLKTYMAQRGRLDRLERQAEVLARQNGKLREEVGLLHDPSHIEKLARCLGMVRPGEIAFVVVDRKGAREPERC